MTVYRICSSIKFTHCYFTDNQQGKARFKLEDCFVLNEHNAVFARSGPLYATCFPGPTRVVDANGISIASAVFAGLTR